MTLGFAVLLIFLCGISVNKIPPCGIAMISNPTAFGETKLFAMLQFPTLPLSETKFSFYIFVNPCLFIDL